MTRLNFLARVEKVFFLFTTTSRPALGSISLRVKQLV
jgi:hypothetical protein